MKKARKETHPYGLSDITPNEILSSRFYQSENPMGRVKTSSSIF